MQETSVDSGARRYTQRELDAVLRSDFYYFVEKVFETVNPGAKYSQNWSIEAVAYVLHKVVRGETTRLIITIPPRNQNRPVHPLPCRPICSDTIQQKRSSASVIATSWRRSSPTTVVP